MKNLHLVMICITLLVTLASCSENKTAETLKADVNTSIQSGDVPTAIILLKNIIKLHPSDGEARFMLGKLYIEQNNFPSAEKELNKAQELSFTSPELKLLIAQSLLTKNDFDAVISTLEQTSFKSKENKILAHFMTGKAYLSINNLDMAKEHINKSNIINNGSPYSLLGLALIAEYQSESEQALALIEKIINTSPILPEALLLKGSIKSRMEEFVVAAESYSDYLKLKPNNLPIKILVAHNLIRAGKYQQAQVIIDDLLLIMDQHPTINLLAAQLALVENKYVIAKELANKVLISTNNGLAQIIAGLSDYYLENDEQAYYQLSAIAGDLPRNHKIHQVLAVLQLKLGYTDELSQTLANIDNQDVENAELFANIGSNLAQQGDLQGANSLFKRAVKLSPESAKIKTQQGILKLLGTDKSGIKDLQDAIALEPTLREANIALTMAYLKQGDIEKAIDISDKWLSKQPNNVFALLLRGNIAIKAEEFDSAKKYFNQAVIYDPNNITPLFNLAVIEAKQENYNISSEFLDKLIDINKEYPPAYRLLISNSMQLKEENTLKIKLSQLIKSFPDAVWPRIILSRKLNIEKKFDDANNILESLNNFEKLPAVYFITLSHNYSTQKKHSKIDLLYSAWQKAQPDNIKAYTTYIGYLNEQEDFQKALSITQVALRNIKLEKDFQLLSFESYFLLLTKKLEQAHAKIQPLARIKPNDAFILRIQGQISMAKKEHNKAVQYLKKSYEQNNDNYTGLYLATAYKSNNNIDAASQFLEVELAKSPSNNIFRKFLAELYISNSPTNAIAHYKTIISSNTNDIVSLNNLAWLLYQNKDLDQALKYSTQAYNLAPNHPQILDTLGIILVGQKNYIRAISILSSAKAISPDNVEIIIHLAQAYKANNNDAEAKLLIEQLTDANRKQWKNEINAL